jgi:arginase
VRNEQELVVYSRLLGQRVGEALDLPGQPPLVLLGGDCSIVLGSLLGASSRGARIGLVYVDAHADFATPPESTTGSAAGMCLAMAVGRGDSPLSVLAGAAPLVRPTDVALIGRRDGHDTAAGHSALAASGILDLGCAELIERGPLWAAEAALARVATDGVDGFWIHLDADVLDSAIMPAVDSPEPDGPSLENVATLVRTLTRHPAALGLQLTIYDPALDTDGACAARLVNLLASVFADASTDVR